MSVETQAILSGHVPIDRIVRLLKFEITGAVEVRDMHRTDYKIVEFQKLDGSWSALNVFLNSWAAEDYADAFSGPSTLITAEYNPQNVNLVRSIAAAIGGLARTTDVEPWLEMEPARI